MFVISVLSVFSVVSVCVLWKCGKAKVVDRNRPHGFLDATAGCSAARLAHLLWEQGVGGSNPLTPTVKIYIVVWAFSSVGRALALHARCRGFESLNAHHYFYRLTG